MSLLPRVLVTGVGGASGIATLRALEGEAELFAVDCDAMAAGLYLVDERHAALLPAASSPAFSQELANLVAEWKIEFIVPTVESELDPLASTGHLLSPAQLLKPDAEPAALCVDKHRLLSTLPGHLVPRSELLAQADLDKVGAFPVLVKPRFGRGSAGVEVIESRLQLSHAYDRCLEAGDADLLLQEYLPGDEYSLDVLADRDKEVRCVVPRQRMKIDSGIAVCARSIKAPELEEIGREVVTSIGLTGVANVQVKADRDGVFKLLEVNPRIPGTIALTIASGVNMPLLMLEEALGRGIPKDLEWQETAMVRYLDEKVIDQRLLLREGQL